MEFTHSEYTLAELYPLMDMGVFKLDSTVDGEFVTLPYCYADMVSRLNMFSHSVDKLLCNNGSSSVEMHVHVSRKGLTKDQIRNPVYLLNPTSLDGQEYWCELANRDVVDYHYCHFIDPTDENAWGDERYVLVNVRNEHTIEFRMFKSPYSCKGVLHKLAIVQGLVEFSKHSSSLEEWKLSSLNPLNK